MSKRIDVNEAAHWSSIASKLRQAADLIADCQLTLLLQLDVTQGKPIEAIDLVSDAIGGLSYMFTPQTEWIGGDSDDPANFVQTLPHIAKYRTRA